MKLSFSKNWIALALSATLSLGITACSDDQSNNPLEAATSAVVVTGTSLQYNQDTNVISGTFTTSYVAEINGTALLTDFAIGIPDCNISEAQVNDGQAIKYTDESNVSASIVVTLKGTCVLDTLTLAAKEYDDKNETISWSEDLKVETLPKGAIISPIVSIVPSAATQSIVLTQNNEPRQILLKVFDVNNVPLSAGEIGVKYPTNSINGIDVGSLNPIAVATVKDGVAIFNYSGPSDIISEVNAGRTSAQFTFFDMANRTKEVDVTITYNPDTTTPPPVLTGYTVDFVASNQQPTTNLETTAVFTLIVKDDKGNLVESADIQNVDITIKQPNLAKFIDNTSKVDTLNFTSKNNIAMTIETYTTSGLVNFQIDLKIKDANGVILNKTFIKSITIFSGPPTAMSISYAYTDQDKENAKFIEKMVFSLTDKWQNPVNTNPTIYAGAITGYTEDPTSTIGNKYMIRDSAVATISSVGSGAKMVDTSGADLSAVDMYNDILMTFGNGYKYQASGKWDIASVGATEITMTDAYSAANPTADMGYAIGHNYRQDVCEFGREWIGQVDSTNKKYIIDETGSAVVDFRYDYQLIGKTIYFGASVVGTINETNETLRMGEAVRHTLRGHGYDGSVACSVFANATTDCRLNVHIKDTASFARNVKFDFEVTGGDNLTLNDTNISSSNLYTCFSGSGVAFVKLNVTNNAGQVDTISISIVEGLIISEF